MYGKGGKVNSRRPLMRLLDRPRFGKSLSWPQPSYTTLATRLAASGLSRSIRAQIRSRSSTQVKTNGFPSGLLKPPQPLAGLLVSQKFTTFQSGLAAFHGFDKSVFFLKVSRHDVLHNFIRLDTLLIRQPR
jgi:hypothetical protein